MARTRKPPNNPTTQPPLPGQLPGIQNFSAALQNQILGTRTPRGIGPGTASPRQITAAGIITNAQLGATLLPANAFIQGAMLRETAGHAVSISLGTTLGGSDILAPVTVPAASGLYVDGASFATSWVSAGAAQPVFVTSASWGGASINATLLYQVGP